MSFIMLNNVNYDKLTKEFMEQQLCNLYEKYKDSLEPEHPKEIKTKEE